MCPRARTSRNMLRLCGFGDLIERASRREMNWSGDSALGRASPSICEVGLVRGVGLGK